MKRGDLIIAVLHGEYGKPHPCLVVQANELADLDSVMLCPLTSDMDTIGATRVIVEPSSGNGLRTTSLVMVDKVTALPRSRCREMVGKAEEEMMEQVDGLLLFVLGLLD